MQKIIALALEMIVLTAPAHAQDPRMALGGPAGPCFAVVVIENRRGLYNRDETLETARGPVTLHYRTVGGHNAVDSDVVEVVSLPPGVIADPMRLDLPDGDTGQVCLLDWIGG